MRDSGLAEIYTYIDEQDRRNVSLQPKARRHPARWMALLPMLATLGVIVAIIRNYDGPIRIAGLGLEAGIGAHSDTPPVKPSSPFERSPAPSPRVAGLAASPPSPSPGGRNGNRSRNQQGFARQAAPLQIVAKGGTVPQPDLRLSVQRGDDQAQGFTMTSEEAEALLEKQDIGRGLSGFVLETEAEVRAKIETLRSRAGEYNAARFRLNKAKGAMDQIDDLKREISALTAEGKEKRLQMAQFQAHWVGNQWWHGMNNIEHDAFMKFKAEAEVCERQRDTVLVPWLEELNIQRPGRDKPEADQAFRQARDAVQAALSDVRDAIASTASSYSRLANDEDVKRALERLDKAEFKPSHQFQADVREYREIERSAVELGIIRTPTRP